MTDCGKTGLVIYAPESIYANNGEFLISDTTSGQYIPTGFTHVSGTDLNNGYTIQDSKGNQYVWVEVPQTTKVYGTSGLKITDFTTDEYTEIEDDLRTYTSAYRSDTSYKDEWSSYDATGLTSSQYTELKQKMLKSIYQNGGFYVGKYETGIENTYRTSGSSTTMPTETPVIKQNVYPYNYVVCNQAQTLASSMESGEYTTSLLFGVQWDLVLKYLETKGATQSELNSDSTSWGNYSNSEWNITNTSSKYTTTYGKTWTNGAYGPKSSASSNVILSTGASDIFSKQGIYDLAGNESEFTLEYATSKSDSPCVVRGGIYSRNGDFTPASNRSKGGAYSHTFSASFRVTLY